MQATTHEYSFFHQHQVMISLAGYYVWSSFVSSLPAPTKDSSPSYVFIFKFFNTLGANLSRAYSNRIEQSPNFQAAVTKQNVIDGTTPIPMQSGIPVPLPPEKL